MPDVRGQMANGERQISEDECRGLIGKEYQEEFTELRPENSENLNVGCGPCVHPPLRRNDHRK